MFVQSPSNYAERLFCSYKSAVLNICSSIRIGGMTILRLNSYYVVYSTFRESEIYLLEYHPNVLARGVGSGLSREATLAVSKHSDTILQGRYFAKSRLPYARFYFSPGC